MAFEPIKEQDYDINFLNRELDKTRSTVFMGNNAAFLASLMCSLDFHWSKECPTAATDGINYWWNPDWFLTLPIATRKSVLMHELWHVARLHMYRLGSRNLDYWRLACDYRINNDLFKEGYTFEGTSPCLDMQYGEMPEEDIYDILMQTQPPIPPTWMPGDGGDMIEPDKKGQHSAVNAVVRAVQQAKMVGQAGNIPGDIEVILEKFLKPVIKWESLLMKFFTDLLDELYTWNRPNRRFQDIYMPARYTDEGRLEHLAYYLDVSGSVSDKDVLRFNSELKYIKDKFNPIKLTMMQFSTVIHDEMVINEYDSFDKSIRKGTGGTSLVCVREHIIENKPTCAVIFSDLFCPPMEKLPKDIPIIWVAVGNFRATVTFGKIIYIKGEN